MLTLNEFYRHLSLSVAPSDRYNTITEIDDVIVVNFDCIYERECGLRGVDQLLYSLHKIGKGKRFLFISEDGANIALSGAVEVINNIIKTFNLNIDTCAVVCREHVDILNANVIVNESVDYWCRVLYPTIKDIGISSGPYSKKFAVWFHRGTVFRLEITKHLYDNYKDDVFISYQEPGVIADRKLSEYFQEEQAWANVYTPIVYDNLFPNRMYDYDMIVGAGRKPYAEYFMEIVVETDVLTSNWITEKTVKNLYIGKPFIVMSGTGTLERLRSRGFKTFSPWIDEIYDTVENIHDRVELVKQEIDRLAKLSYNELTIIQTEMMPIFEHNRKTYENYINRRR